MNAMQRWRNEIRSVAAASEVSIELKRKRLIPRVNEEENAPTLRAEASHCAIRGCRDGG